MDKITRIHLARIPYEIGIVAQKQLNEYLEDIRNRLDTDLADETMADIEVRITEILADKSIKKNDVITAEDITAIKEQLGSPEQFDTNETKTERKGITSNEAKKLLRDKDSALVGGVASGLAAYLNIDPVFVRIAFIILTFFWGFGIALYLLLWLMVPAAISSSDKLLMRGESVTAATLQRYRDSTEKTISNIRLQNAFGLGYKLVRLLLTLGSILFILGLLILVGIASAALYSEPLHPIFTHYHLNYLLLGLAWLLIMLVIGLVVVMLLRLWQKQKSSLKIACFTLLGLLVITIASLSVVTPFTVSHYQNVYSTSHLATTIPIKTTKNSPLTSLQLLADNNLNVNYIVSNQSLHATYENYPGMGHPNIVISSDSGMLTISATQLKTIVPSCVLGWCKNIYLPVKVTIYGPALQSYSVYQAGQLNLWDLNQSNLTISAQNSSEVNLTNSFSTTLNLKAETNSTIFANNVNSNTANISVDGTSYILSPASTNLAANLPENCDQTAIEVPQTPSVITLNNKGVTAQTFNQNSCIMDDNYTSPNPPSAP